MTVIFIIIAILFFVLLKWTWHSLGEIEKYTKVICIITGIVVMYLLTFLIFNISKSGIYYENIEIMKKIRIVFVLMFTPINGYIVLPYLFRKMDQVNNEEIQKQELQRSIVVILIVFFALMLIEKKYLCDIQQGILSIMH